METNDQANRRRVVVLGLGCAGGRIVARLGDGSETGNYQVVVADTDHRDLPAREGVTAIRLGQEWNCHEGCGGDPEMAEKIFSGAEESLRELFDQASLLIVVAGLGAGTGTGGAKILAKIVRDRDIPSLFVVTFPFSFEGNWPRRRAEEALDELRAITDAVMVVHNDLLFTAVAADVPARQAFQQIDQILAKTIFGLLGIAWAEWLLKADFATIRNLLREHPERCHLGFGVGSGEERWRQAVESFIKCPLLGGSEHLRQTSAAIITVGSNSDLSVAELRHCMAAVQHHFPEQTRLLVGAYTSPIHAGEVQITGVCCRFKPADVPAPATVLKDHTTATETQPETREIPEREYGHSGKDRNKRTKPGKQGAVQEELPFPEERLGIFSAAPPTIFRGENLDVPTFQRREIQLDLG